MSLKNFISGGIRTSEGMRGSFSAFPEFSDESVVQQSDTALGPENESTVVAIVIADTGPDNESANVAAAALPCAAHSPILPLTNFSHPPFQPQRFPPPWALQKFVLPCALFPHPSSWHRLPPPCVTQCSVRPLALRGHPSMAHRLPPPCATQKLVPPCTLFGQTPSSPLCEHRRPPP